MFEKELGGSVRPLPFCVEPVSVRVLVPHEAALQRHFRFAHNSNDSKDGQDMLSNLKRCSYAKYTGKRLCNVNAFLACHFSKRVRRVIA